MFKLTEDTKKIAYFGQAHSGKILALSNSVPNGSPGAYLIGALTVPIVVSLADGQELTFNGETLPHPSKWAKVCEEEDEESPIFDCSLFSGGGMIDIKSPDFDFTSLVAARKIDDSPSKKSRHE